MECCVIFLISRTAYTILESVLTKVAGTVLSDAILGHRNFGKRDISWGMEKILDLEDDQKLADIMSIIEWGIPPQTKKE